MGTLENILETVRGIPPAPCDCANCHNWKWISCLLLLAGGILFSILVLEVTNQPGHCTADMLNLTKSCNLKIQEANALLAMKGLPQHISFNTTPWEERYNASQGQPKEENACYAIQ